MICEGIVLKHQRKSLFYVFTLWITIFLALAGPLQAAVPALMVEPVATLGRGWINDVAWSPADNQVAVATSIGIWLYDPANLDAPPRLLAGHSEPVSSIAYSSDGQKLVSGAWDNTVRVWDVQSGAEQAILEGHNSFVESVAFSPDGQSILSGSMDTSVRLWALNTNTQLHAFSARENTGHSNVITSVAFSPDGRFFASSSRYDPQLVILWDAVQQQQIASLSGMRGFEMQSVAFSSDSRLLAAVSADGGMDIWDTSTHEMRTHFPGVVDVAFQPGGVLVASGSMDGSIALWNLDTQQQQGILSGESDINRFDFSPDGQRLISTNERNQLQLWDVGQGAEIAHLDGWHNGGINAIAFGPDPSVLIAGGGDSFSGPREVNQWDPESQRQRAVLTLWDTTTQQQAVLPTDGGYVKSLAISPNGSTLVVGTEQGILEFRDGTTGERRISVQGHEGRVLSVVFSSNSAVVATGGEDASAHIWNPLTAEERSVLTDLGGPVQHINISDEGTLLPSAGIEDVTELAAEDQYSIACVLGTNNPVTSMLYSPDRRYVASAYWNTEVELVDLETGELHVVLQGHTGGIWSIAFTPDSRIIATAGMDRTVRLWDVATGEMLNVLDGPLWDINSVAFSADGSLLAAGSGDGTIHVWRISPTANSA